MDENPILGADDLFNPFFPVSRWAVASREM